MGARPKLLKEILKFCFVGLALLFFFSLRLRVTNSQIKLKFNWYSERSHCAPLEDEQPTSFPGQGKGPGNEIVEQPKRLENRFCIPCKVRQAPPSILFASSSQGVARAYFE